MAGHGPRFDGRPISVLVYEHVTGGGLAGKDLPESWAVEGSAMRRVIARDFASVPGVCVLMMLDARLPMEDHPGVAIRLVEDQGEAVLKALAKAADHTLTIAPETDDCLARLSLQVSRAGGRGLGSRSQAIRLTGDKGLLAAFLVLKGLPTPATRIIGGLDREIPDDWRGPIIVKPRDGAGSVDARILHDRQCPDWFRRDQTAVIQPFLPGQPMSASFLVDVHGQATLLGVGRQRIEIDEAGRISYQGGTILAGVDEPPPVVEAAVNCVLDHFRGKSLRGFVGVDYLDDPACGITILEINPRPTTSYVGLAKMLGPGTIAGAWLDAMKGPLDRTDWPDKIRLLRQASDVTFLADGSIVSEDSHR